MKKEVKKEEEKVETPVLEEEETVFNAEEVAENQQVLSTGTTRYTGFQRFVRRNVIKVRQRLYLIPLFITTLAMIVLYIGMYFTVYTINLLGSSAIEGFLFFVLSLASVLNILIYAYSNSKSKKPAVKIIFLVMFILVTIGQIAIDINLHLAIEGKVAEGLMRRSGRTHAAQAYNIIHIVLLIISLISGIVLPRIQHLVSNRKKSKKGV